MPQTSGISLNTAVKALTPEGIEFILSPAGLPARTFAFAIDRLIQWFILAIVTFLFIYILSNFIGIWVILILNFIIEWFYHVVCELCFRGQSPGKRLMGIRVVKSDGSPVDAASSILRNLLRFADTFFFLFHVSFLTMAASPAFKRVGDWAGDTIVVYSSIAKNTIHVSLNRSLEKYAPENPSRPLSSEEKQAILNFARRYPLLGEARANEIAGVYAPLIRNEESGVSDAAFLLGAARKLSGETL